SAVPVRVRGLWGVTAISAGEVWSLALRADGTVWAWGDNSWGQLANDQVGVPSPTPVRVRGLAGMVAVAAGYAHGLALGRDGTVWAWGDDEVGQLGDGGAYGSRPTPGRVAVLAGVTAVATGSAFGSSHSLALEADGSVWAWGNNSDGQLGRATGSC